jgi:hypothetical protein
MGTSAAAATQAGNAAATGTDGSGAGEAGTGIGTSAPHEWIEVRAQRKGRHVSVRVLADSGVRQILPILVADLLLLAGDAEVEEHASTFRLSGNVTIGNAVARFAADHQLLIPCCPRLADACSECAGRTWAQALPTRPMRHWAGRFGPADACVMLDIEGV